MRQAITISNPNEAPKVQIDNLGTMSLYNFAKRIYDAGGLEYRILQNSKRIAFTNGYATALLNQFLHLFPAEF